MHLSNDLTLNINSDKITPHTTKRIFMTLILISKWVIQELSLYEINFCPEFTSLRSYYFGKYLKSNNEVF